MTSTPSTSTPEASASAVTFSTNRHWRPFTYRSDVPAKVLADQFDHLTEDEAFDGFFRYRGYWYHLSDFMQAPRDMFGEAAPFRIDGYMGDSYFSGVLIQVAKDGEAYRVATYYS